MVSSFIKIAIPKKRKAVKMFLTTKPLKKIKKKFFTVFLVRFYYGLWKVSCDPPECK